MKRRFGLYRCFSLKRLKLFPLTPYIYVEIEEGTFEQSVLSNSEI